MNSFSEIVLWCIGAFIFLCYISFEYFLGSEPVFTTRESSSCGVSWVIDKVKCEPNSVNSLCVICVWCDGMRIGCVTTAEKCIGTCSFVLSWEYHDAQGWKEVVSASELFCKKHYDFALQNPIWCRWSVYLPLTQDTWVRVPVSEHIFWNGTFIPLLLTLWYSDSIKISFNLSWKPIFVWRSMIIQIYPQIHKSNY